MFLEWSLAHFKTCVPRKVNKDAKWIKRHAFSENYSAASEVVSTYREMEEQRGRDLSVLSSPFFPTPKNHPTGT